MNALLQKPIIAVTAAAGAAMLIALAPVSGEPADFASWQPESYPAVDGFPDGIWQVSPDGLSVVQTANGQPAVLISPHNSGNLYIDTTVSVSDADDDDFFGFVVGFSPGDSSDESAEFLLIDWKAGTQTFDFGDPSCTPGATANAGLALSRVSGVPTADEFWGHTNFDAACSDATQGVEELARAATLGATGWAYDIDYAFRIETTPDRLMVYVNNVLEIDQQQSIPDGNFGLYTFSQVGVTFSGVDTTAPTPSPTPEPTPSPSPEPTPSPSPTPEPTPSPSPEPTPSPSPTPKPSPEPTPTPPACRADVNGDGAVTLRDLIAVAKALGSKPGHPRWHAAADVNADGRVTAGDLVIVALSMKKGRCL